MWPAGSGANPMAVAVVLVFKSDTHTVDTSWGSLLQYGLELTGAEDGFYWASNDLKANEDLVWCSILAWAPNNTNSTIHKEGTAHWSEPEEPLNRFSVAYDEILIPSAPLRGRLSAGPEGGVRNYTSRCRGVAQV